jgi:hypothetical protein
MSSDCSRRWRVCLDVDRAASQGTWLRYLRPLTVPASGRWLVLRGEGGFSSSIGYTIKLTRERLDRRPG